MTSLRASLAAALRGILLLAAPASAGLILLASTDRRGLCINAGEFDERMTALVSWALLWFAAGLVGHSMLEVLTRAFYAQHDTRTPVIVGASAMGLNVILSIAALQLVCTHRLDASRRPGTGEFAGHGSGDGNATRW